MTDRAVRSPHADPVGEQPPGGVGASRPLLWVSNAPWAAVGYSVQTQHFTPRIRDLGWDVTIFGFYGLEGAVLGWNGIPVLPRYANPFGNDIVVEHAAKTFRGRKGLVIVQCDVWVMDTNAYRQLPCAAWAPIDHDPAQPPTVRWYRETGATPIALPLFGQKALEAEGLEAMYVPCGVDTNALRPLPQAESRAQLGLPQDAYIVG